MPEEIATVLSGMRATSRGHSARDNVALELADRVECYLDALAATRSADQPIPPSAWRRERCDAEMARDAALEALAKAVVR
jgi:hypothetical protein